jgi:hypothetical protein
LGGQGVVVEIDESLVYKPKYNIGRRRVQGWVFGMVERGTRNVVVVPVDRRDAATLLPIIQEWIEDGSIIMSDGWAAYGGINNLPNGYQHFAVNHRVCTVPINFSHKIKHENTLPSRIHIDISCINL